MGPKLTPFCHLPILILQLWSPSHPTPYWNSAPPNPKLKKRKTGICDQIIDELRDRAQLRLCFPSEDVYIYEALLGTRCQCDRCGYGYATGRWTVRNYGTTPSVERVSAFDKIEFASRPWVLPVEYWGWHGGKPRFFHLQELNHSQELIYSNLSIPTHSTLLSIPELQLHLAQQLQYVYLPALPSPQHGIIPFSFKRRVG